MATFTYAPQTASKSLKPRVRVAAFGDGYEQRVADGINTSPAQWSLSFVRITAEADAILAFLAARAGTEAFDWSAPDGVAGRYVCRDWSSSLNGPMAKTVTATFEEVFGA